MLHGTPVRPSSSVRERALSSESAVERLPCRIRLGSRRPGGTAHADQWAGLWCGGQHAVRHPLRPRPVRL